MNLNRKRKRRGTKNTSPTNKTGYFGLHGQQLNALQTERKTRERRHTEGNIHKTAGGLHGKT